MMDDHNSIEFKKASFRFMIEIHNFVSFCTKELNIDATDWQIYSCVLHYSTKNGNMFEYNDPYFAKEVNYSHGIINAKSIYLTLGMPRETVRTRLIYLDTKGAIKKDNKGYFVKPSNDIGHLEKYDLVKPYQNIRTYLLKSMERWWDQRNARLKLNDPFPHVDMNSIGFRQESVSIISVFFLATAFCMKELSISAIDLHLLLSVYINSDPSIDSNLEVGIVSAETIQHATGMARETVRRRLLYLEFRGFINKSKNGYTMVPQFGSGNHTENIRKYFLKTINQEIQRTEIIMALPVKHKSELATQRIN